MNQRPDFSALLDKEFDPDRALAEKYNSHHGHGYVKPEKITENMKKFHVLEKAVQAQGVDYIQELTKEQKEKIQEAYTSEFGFISPADFEQALHVHQFKRNLPRQTVPFPKSSGSHRVTKERTAKQWIKDVKAKLGDGPEAKRML